MASYRRVSVNTSLKNARIFDDMYFADDALDYDFISATANYSNTAASKPQNSSDSNKVQLGCTLTMVRQEDCANVKIKTEPLDETHMSNENPSEYSKPSTSCESSVKKNVEIDTFWNIKQEVSDEDSVQEAKRDYLCNNHNSKQVVYDENTNEDASRDSRCKQNVKNCKKRVFIHHSPYQKPQLEMLHGTDKVNQCVKNLSLERETSPEYTNDDSCGSKNGKSSRKSIFTNHSPYKRARLEISGAPDNADQSVRNSYLDQKVSDGDEESSHDSCSNQSRKSNRKTNFTRHSPYQKPQLEVSNPTDRVNQCARKLSVGKRRMSKPYELEMDPAVLCRRQKQIDFGKNTAGYDNYTKAIPRSKRTRADPTTPDKFRKYSRRGWDGLIKHWRLRLHNYDDY